ncbi:hypothetical protein D4R78_08035 [bacterium]|nr:MAG: hypothetical protein D4R78_08035 [bacterium]
MKLKIILFVVCAFVCFSIGVVSADDVSDLKAQLKALQEQMNTLNAKIQDLEAKQEAQVKEVKKVPELEKTIDKLKEGPASLLEGVTVGGHLKFTLFDRTQGKRNGVDQHNNLSGGFYGNDNLFLFFSKTLDDWLRLDVQTKTEVAATATPALGSDIGRATSTSTSTSIYQAFLTVRLPKEFELKAGKFNPMFSEDYAKETWWHQLYNLPKGTCTILAWHDTGAELYKNFDFDKWSLPVYLSLLNGGTSSDIDNNEQKTILLHVAPEFFQTKLRLLGSFAYGKWDNKGKEDLIRTAAGFDWKYQKFNLLGEYIYWEKKNVLIPSSGTVPTADGVNQGYWIRGIYTFNPKWRAIVQQSYSNLYQTALTGQMSMISDKYYVTTLGLDFSLTPSSTIIGQYDKGNASRSDGSESLKYDRFTMGWRTTF